MKNITWEEIVESANYYGCGITATIVDLENEQIYIKKGERIIDEIIFDKDYEIITVTIDAVKEEISVKISIA